MTNDQLESIRTARLQLLDHGDEAAAKALDWVLTAEPSGWRPVETAPKDQYVLCWWSPERIEGAAWDWDEYTPNLKHWHYMQDGDAPNNAPLYWMPLPQPPEA